MKLVVLSIPNCVPDSEIKEGLTNFAIQLDIASIKVNILEEKDIKIDSINSIIGKDIDEILKDCMNQDNLISIANFWRNVSTGKINKQLLLNLTKNRIALRAYLQKKNAEYFLKLFDTALLMM